MNNSFLFRRQLNFILLFFVVFMFGGVLQVKAVRYVSTPATSWSQTSGGNPLVTEKGSFKVYYDGTYDNTQFAYYKIVDVFCSTSSKEVKYQFTTDFQTFLNNSTEYRSLTVDQFMSMNIGDAQSTKRYPNHVSDSIVSGGYLTSSEFAKLMSDYAEYLRKNGKTGTIFSYAYDPGSNYPYAYRIAENVPVGTYLILPTSVDHVYAVMVDSVKFSYESSSSRWRIDDANVLAKRSQHTIAGIATQGSESGNSISVTCAQNIRGKLTIAIPNFPADAPFKRIDIQLGTLDDGNINSYSINGMTLQSSNNGVQNASIVKNGVTIGSVSNSPYIVFSFPDASKIGSTIEISYPINPLDCSKAVIGGSGNTVKATMKMLDPYASSADINVTETATMTLYTYALQITGTAGAVFDVKQGTTNLGSITIPSDGIGVLKGLQSGTYTVTQKKAPAGYALLSGSQTVKVGSGGTQVSGKSGYYNITLQNTAPAILPYTGSKGAIIFTVVGAIVTLFSIIFLVVYKKKKVNDIEEVI